MFAVPALLLVGERTDECHGAGVLSRGCVVEASLPAAKPEDISIFTRTLPITAVMRLSERMRQNSKESKETSTMAKA
jgi:hypothetical protein